MNYSSLLPVLKIVTITVLALIEVAPARTGDRPVSQDDIVPSATTAGAARCDVARETHRDRAPALRPLVSARALGEHGYSSKLHLNSE